jgi:hypothetical protein
MIRKLKDGRYRLYSRKKDPKTGRRRNLGTFGTRAAALKHERAVSFSNAVVDSEVRHADDPVSQLQGRLRVRVQIL